MRALILLCFALSSCAGSQEHYRLLEASGDLQVSPSQTPGSDYIVSIRNKEDFGFNPDEKSVRDRTALGLLKTQCPKGEIAGETVIDTGKYITGSSAKTYSVFVKCSPSQP